LKQTTNYNLNKIELLDSPPDITVHSQNFDIIDEELKNNADAISSHLADKTNTTIHSLALTKNLALYVSPNGNDVTGDGSQNEPFRQISKALSIVPKNLNGYAVTIFCEEGTYQKIEVAGYFGSTNWEYGIKIIGNNSLDVSLSENYIIENKSSIFQNAVSVLIKGFNFKDRLLVYNNNKVTITVCMSDTVKDIGIEVIGGLVNLGILKISNKIHAAIKILTSVTYIYNISGIDNTVGYRVGDANNGQGGILIKTGSNTLTATTLNSIFGGSQIFE